MFKFQILKPNVNFLIMSIAKNFEKLLRNFFALYHPRQVKKVGRIVQEFKGQELMLLKVLCDKYKKAYTVIPGLNEELQELYADPPEEETKEIETKEDSIVDETSNEEIVSEEEEEVKEEEVVTETEEEEEEK